MSEQALCRHSRAEPGQGWMLRRRILVRWLLTAAMAASQYACSFPPHIGGSTGTHFSGGISHAFSFVGVLVMGFGLLMLYGALQNYRKFRVLGASPVIPIRDVAAGMVHVLGKAVGDNPLTSPLTRQPCFYYQVMVDKEQGGRNGQWSMCLRHTDHTKFYVQDATGKVLVDLHQAQLDATQTFRRQIRSNAGAQPDSAGGLSDGELWDYLVRINAQIHTELASRGESVLHAITQTESSVTRLPPDFSGLEGGLHLCITETCLLADRDCNILGTCLDNPNPGGAGDRMVIARGANRGTFVISSRAEPELEAKSKRGSYILLAVGGAVFLLGLALFSV